MAVKQTKLLTVASNGQISIGKSWAGRQIIVEEMGEGVLHIKAGTFIPDNQKTFHTKSSQDSLEAFNHWEVKQNKKPVASSEVLAQLKKQRKARGK